MHFWGWFCVVHMNINSLEFKPLWIEIMRQRQRWVLYGKCLCLELTRYLSVQTGCEQGILKQSMWVLWTMLFESKSQFDLAPCSGLEHLFILSAAIFSHHALWNVIDTPGIAFLDVVYFPVSSSSAPHTRASSKGWVDTLQRTWNQIFQIQISKKMQKKGSTVHTLACVCCAFDLFSWPCIIFWL